MGREKKPEFRQRGDGNKFVENIQGIYADMKIIANHAADYWNNSRSPRRMRCSFEGYTISPSIASTKNGNYSLVEVRDDTIYVRAASSVGSGIEYFQIDWSGQLRSLVFGEYRPPKVHPEIRNIEDALTMYKKS